MVRALRGRPGRRPLGPPAGPRGARASMTKPKRDPDHFAIWTARGTTYMRMPLVAFIGGLLALVVLTIIVWSEKREPDTEMKVGDVGELRTLMPSLVGLTHSNLDPGNRIEILQNGDGFFPLLFRDIEAARESIHLETFIWYEGQLTTKLAAALAKKAREGVEVRILADASGGRDLKGDTREMLESAGARVALFHPFRISNIARLNNRDHRKLVIIDGRIAYTGGFGFADEWMGNGQDKKHYRDTSLRIQ